MNSKYSYFLKIVMYNKTGHCYVTKGISKIIHGKF